jgi:hypothetical protein
VLAKRSKMLRMTPAWYASVPRSPAAADRKTLDCRRGAAPCRKWEGRGCQLSAHLSAATYTQNSCQGFIVAGRGMQSQKCTTTSVYI